ncbi:MAG: Ig-like domain-containing protein [Candidatus Thiodiazotropha endolucinida]
MKQTLKPIVVACALALGAGQANAYDVYLIAKEFTLDLPGIPSVDNPTQDPTMWGYALDVDSDNDGVGDCYAAGNPADAACVGPTASAPGPRITIPPTDTDLNIFLTNMLPEPTSLVIPGQPLPNSGGVMGPTWDNGNVNASGTRDGDLTLKMRSYGVEAPAGGTQQYNWTAVSNNPIDNSGSFIYHTGTLPQKQLYMGLYGAVTKDAAAAGLQGNVLYDLDGTVGNADDVTYANELILFYSDVDTHFNEEVIAGTLQTAIERHPKWYMINGQPYHEFFQDIETGEAGALTTSGPTLLRFMSAATEKHVPVLQGLYGTIHAEDGIQYTYEDDTGVHAAPVEQYSVGLPPLKTKDVIIQPTYSGRYAIYDGNGNMTNPSDPGNFGQGDEIGGMLRFLGFNVGANQPPIANADPITIQIPEVYNQPSYQVLNQVIDVLANDFDPDVNDTLALVDLFPFPPNPDTSIPDVSIDFVCSSVNANCTLTLDNSLIPASTGGGNTQLTYEVTAGGVTVPGTVDVTVEVNSAPVLNAASQIVVTEDQLDTSGSVTVDLLADASDSEGDTISLFNSQPVITSPGGTIATVLGCDYPAGTCTINFGSENPPFELGLSFTMTDGINVVEGQTATVSLAFPGPTLFDDTTTLDQVGALDLDANDANLPATYGLALVPTSTPSGSVTVNDDGTIVYTPPAGTFTGDTFTYCLTATSATEDCLAEPPAATVTINPAPASGLIAVGGKTYTIDEDSILDVLDVDGLLAGESPINGGTLAVVVETTGAPTCANTTAGSFFLDGATGSFHYEPLLDWNSVNPPVDNGDACLLNDDPGARGADTITYHLVESYDDGGTPATITSNTVTAEITVNPVNDAPVAVNDTFYVQDASTAVLDGQGEPVSMTFSVAPDGVLENDTDLENDGLLATEVNDPDNLDPALGIDGSIPSFAIDPVAVGVLTSIEYEASDLVAQSNTATADIVRQISVTRASYQRRGNDATGNDRWRIRGLVDPAIPTTGNTPGVNVYLVRVDTNGTPSPRIPIVVTVSAGNNNSGRIRASGGQHVWGLNVNNVGNRRPEIELPDGNDYLEVEVIDANFPNAVYYNVPIDIEP